MCFIKVKKLLIKELQDKNNTINVINKVKVFIMKPRLIRLFWIK